MGVELIEEVDIMTLRQDMLTDPMYVIGFLPSFSLYEEILLFGELTRL